MRVKRLMVWITLCVLPCTAVLPAFAWETVPEGELKAFTDAFMTVPENPLPGDLSWLLWMISQESPPEEANTELTPLQLAAAKFAALIQEKGVHYEESTSFMGMDMRSEYWMQGGKLKKHDHMSDEVILLDGAWFYKYSPGSKTGVRLTPDHPDAVFVISMIKNSMLSALANSPYKQEEDAKESGYDCQVFYLDMEFMGMKGNWLYVDKTTGAMVKYQFGKDKDSMSTVLAKLETGTFGDEVFMVPENIKLTGP